MNRNLRRSLACSTLALALGVAPSLPVLAATSAGLAAQAAPEGDPEALSNAAVEKFQAKEYDAAVELFEQAYAIDPEPNYLFNIGRVYEEKGDLENAVVYYQRFVGQSGVELESRQAATERLKVLREALQAMKADEEPVPVPDEPPPDETQPPGDDEGAGSSDPTVDDGSPPDDGTARRKKIMRLTGYGLLGAGGVGLIVGAVFGGLASAAIDDAEADRYVERRIAFRQRAKNRARVADAMFITGGVLAAAGLALVLSTLGGKRSNKSDVARRTTWEPVIGPEQVGLGLTHRF